MKKNKSKINIFNSIKDLTTAVADLILGDAEIAESEKRDLSIALSGGNTPRILYQRLAEDPYATTMPWENIQLFWGDERCVPPRHPDSNYGMAYENLLKSISIPEANIHRIRGEDRPNEEAARYIREIKLSVKRTRKQTPVFDIVLLGLGKDGHTASLFPGSPCLEEKDILCHSTIHPVSGRKRITFTLPLINNSDEIIFIVTGKEKAGIVAEVAGREKSASKYPASMVKPVAGKVQWFLDSNAAEMIK